jgi:hypothetical protein
VADTLKTVGRDMRGKEVDEEDVEEHVSSLIVIYVTPADRFR